MTDPSAMGCNGSTTYMDKTSSLANLQWLPLILITTFICVYIYIHIHIYVYIYINKCLCMKTYHICVHNRCILYIYIYIHILYIYIYRYTLASNLFGKIWQSQAINILELGCTFLSFWDFSVWTWNFHRL